MGMVGRRADIDTVLRTNVDGGSWLRADPGHAPAAVGISS
jgi:hypothetical protein